MWLLRQAYRDHSPAKKTCRARRWNNRTYSTEMFGLEHVRHPLPEDQVCVTHKARAPTKVRFCRRTIVQPGMQTLVEVASSWLGLIEVEPNHHMLESSHASPDIASHKLHPKRGWSYSLQTSVSSRPIPSKERPSQTGNHVLLSYESSISVMDNCSEPFPTMHRLIEKNRACVASRKTMHAKRIRLTKIL